MGRIKKSVSLSLFQGGKAAPMLFMGDVERNVPKIADMGYDGVDLFVIDPAKTVSKRAKVLLRENKLGVGAVMPAGLAARGLTLGDIDDEKRRELLLLMRPIIEFAAEVGGMVSLGLVRGSVKAGDTEEAFFKRFSASCEELLKTSERENVKLVIEPINRYEINTLNSSLSALKFIKRSGLPLYLMLDTFHMNIEDKSIAESFIECRDYVKHIHFLDSNRLAPGMGHLDMAKIYETIKTIGYEGFLCLEALREPDGETVARRGMEFFKSIGV